MSFYTSLVYYRPCKPPDVTAADVAQFLVKVRDSGIATGGGFQSLQVKFGKSIDQYEKGTSWEEEVAPRMFETHDIEWDLELSDTGGIQELIDALASKRRRIYRAYVGLGNASDALVQPITRTNSPENEYDYYPESLSLEIGPIEIYDLASPAPAHVGWMAVSIAGNGYLYPWTFRDVLDRLQQSPEVQRLTEVCRTLWPVVRKTPDRRVIALRQQIGQLWPYDSLDLRWDWYWGPRESG